MTNYITVFVINIIIYLIHTTWINHNKRAYYSSQENEKWIIMTWLIFIANTLLFILALTADVTYDTDLLKFLNSLLC